ncbi:muts domain V-domain-containing protein [Cladochytrium replicatum]|nr:muts domain V-domain-containing protein [Cladochytrium replicatum]
MLGAEDFSEARRSEERPELSLDKGSEQGFCQFFRSLPEKPDSTIRIFERSGGDYYSVHGDDALYVAHNVYKTASVLKNLGGEGTRSVPSCTLSRLNAIAFVRDLLVHKLFRVEIWAAELGRKNSWSISKRASPGNLQEVEDMIFTAGEVSASPVVLAVKVAPKGDQKIVGVAFTDATSNHRLGLAEFIDNDIFSNFESLLIQLEVKECIIPDDANNYDLKKIKKILDRCNVVITERKKADFTTKDIEQDLNRLLSDDVSLGLPEFELKNALSCLASVIKYLHLMEDESSFGQYSIETHDLTLYMRLDAAAVRALNLMPRPQDGTYTTFQCNCTLTQKQSQWLKQPLLSIAEIRVRHDLVEALTASTELRQSLQDEHLKAFPDLQRLAKRFLKGSANLQDVVRIYQVVLRLPDLVHELEAYNRSHMQLIRDTYAIKLNGFIERLDKLKELVETTIDLEALNNHEFLINPDFDPDLEQLKGEMNKTFKEIQKQAQKIADDLDYELDKKLKFEKSPQYGYHMRLSRNEAGRIRANSSYIEIATLKNGVLFTTSKLRSLNGDFESLNEQYEQKQGNVVKEVLSITGSYLPVLEPLNLLIAHLDVLVSFAHAGLHAPIQYVRPKMTERGVGDVILKSARHPCLEMQDEVSFIANDVELIRDMSMFHIITGPNMGGKSTYIRQIGVISLMAQIGCFVPCSSATLCIFDSVLARVGAGDSQLKGVSTFMAEMLETSSILKSATRDSLIIIDELGRGTSTYDGFGLAWAISEHIATQIQCFALFATHFHELTALSEQVPTVKNWFVKAATDQNRITLLYKVVEGVCDQSFGIHVAELANFPQEVVKMAKRKACELEDFSTEQEVDASGLYRPWKCAKTDVDEGSAVIENFLHDFATEPRLTALQSGNQGSERGNDGDDPMMDVAPNGETLLQVLGELRAKYQDELEQSPFVKEVLLSL